MKKKYSSFEQSGDRYMGHDLELAKAYVPFQIYDRSFPLEEALEKGTLFPELYRPYPKGKSMF